MFLLLAIQIFLVFSGEGTCCFSVLFSLFFRISLASLTRGNPLKQNKKVKYVLNKHAIGQSYREHFRFNDFTSIHQCWLNFLQDNFQNFKINISQQKSKKQHQNIIAQKTFNFTKYTPMTTARTKSIALPQRANF